MTEPFCEWWERVLPDPEDPAEAARDTATEPDIALTSTAEADDTVHAAAEAYAEAVREAARLPYVPDPSIRWDRARGAYYPVIPGTHFGRTKTYFTDLDACRLFAIRTWMARWHRTQVPSVRQDLCLFTYHFHHPADRARYRAYYKTRDGGILGRWIPISGRSIAESIRQGRPALADDFDDPTLPSSPIPSPSRWDQDRRRSSSSEPDADVGLHFGPVASLTRGAYRPTSRSARPGDYADSTWIIWSFRGPQVKRWGAFVSERDARNWALDHGFAWVDCQNHPAVTAADFADPAPLVIDPAVIQAARDRLHPRGSPEVSRKVS